LQTENIRVAYIDTIPPGSSTVTFRISVAQEQYALGKLTLKSFKVGRRLLMLMLMMMMMPLLPLLLLLLLLLL
jgi:hypothetical protein